MNIKNLGAHYPPAKQALETRRDERQAALAAGSTDPRVAQDLVALNNSLGQEDKNLTLFDSLPAGSKSRSVVLAMMTDQLLKSRRYQDVIPDGGAQAAFQKAADRYTAMMNSMGNSPAKAQMEEHFRDYTTRQGTKYFEALAGLKRDQDAKDLAAQILKFDSSATTRESLAEAAQRAQNTDLAQYLKQ